MPSLPLRLPLGPPRSSPPGSKTSSPRSNRTSSPRNSQLGLSSSQYLAPTDNGDPSTSMRRSSSRKLSPAPSPTPSASLYDTMELLELPDSPRASRVLPRFDSNPLLITPLAGEGSQGSQSPRSRRVSAVSAVSGMSGMSGASEDDRIAQLIRELENEREAHAHARKQFLTLHQKHSKTKTRIEKLEEKLMAADEDLKAERRRANELQDSFEEVENKLYAATRKMHEQEKKWEHERTQFYESHGAQMNQGAVELIELRKKLATANAVIADLRKAHEDIADIEQKDRFSQFLYKLLKLNLDDPARRTSPGHSPHHSPRGLGQHGSTTTSTNDLASIYQSSRSLFDSTRASSMSSTIATSSATALPSMVSPRRHHKS